MAYTHTVSFTMNAEETKDFLLQIMTMEGLKKGEKKSVEREDYESAQLYKNEIDKRNGLL